MLWTLSKFVLPAAAAVRRGMVSKCHSDKKCSS